MQEPRVIYADEQIIAVDKPSGMIVHGAAENTEPTLVDWLLQTFPDIAGVGEDPLRPGIVHRIDKETSGILLVARTSQAFVNIKRQFARREIQKTYRAFVYGAVEDDRGTIDKPIGRGKGSGSRRSVRDAHGVLREAHTIFRTITRSAGASYLEVFPKTGRTHQIRVHLAFVHHPVVCDRLYAPSRVAVLGFQRLALHALSLRFTHPQTGREMFFEAPLPPDFVEAEKELRVQ